MVAASSGELGSTAKELQIRRLTLQTRAWLPVQGVIPCLNTAEEDTFPRCYPDTRPHSKLTVPAAINPRRTVSAQIVLSGIDCTTQAPLITKSRYIYICYLSTKPPAPKYICNPSTLHLFLGYHIKKLYVAAELWRTPTLGRDSLTTRLLCYSYIIQEFLAPINVVSRASDTNQ